MERETKRQKKVRQQKIKMRKIVRRGNHFKVYIISLLMNFWQKELLKEVLHIKTLF